MKEQSFFEKWSKVIKKMSLGKENLLLPGLPLQQNPIHPSDSWCNCEETKDEFGGCVPGSANKCLACGKIMSNKTIKKYKKRLLKELGWQKEFEYKLYNNGIQINESIFFKDLVTKYLAKYNDKVKIKCKDGCIQIEKVK